MKLAAVLAALALLIWWHRALVRMLPWGDPFPEWIPGTKITVKNAWARIKAANPGIVDLPWPPEPETGVEDPRLFRPSQPSPEAVAALAESINETNLGTVKWDSAPDGYRDARLDAARLYIIGLRELGFDVRRVA